MRIQIASDLHHEASPRSCVQAQRLPLAPSAEVLVLAGDIHEGTSGVDLYATYPIPVVYVHGNQEPLRCRYPELVCELEERAHGTSVRFLQNDECVIGTVRFLGAWLWTDYMRHPLRFSDSLDIPLLELVDFKDIRRRDNGHFRLEEARQHQRETLLWLRERLDTPFSGKTVVVTHHLPSALSIPHATREHALAPACASNIELLALRADVWVHGHIHASCDYQIGNCRVLCNPRGRPGRNRTHPNVPYENATFNSGLVIDV